MIDANEAADPNAKLMLDRIFSQIGKEPHYPMSISEIAQSYEAYYRSRANSGGGGPSRSSTPQSGSLTTSSGLQSLPGMGFGTPASPSLTSVSSGRPYGPGGFNPSAAGSTTPYNTSQGSASSSDSKSGVRKPVRFPTARERLPKGLPDWFLEKDVNGEGQVTMAEFATNWTPAEVEKFNRYDLNGDGIITAAECLKVEKASSSKK
jgi:hypothetical protein